MADAKEAPKVCSGCKHWALERQGNTKKAGRCKRYAPRVETSGGPVSESQWPITLEDNSCSEFDRSTPHEVVQGVPVADPRADDTAAKPAKRTPRKTAKGGKGRATR